MSEPELVLESASVKVWFQPGIPGADEFWVNFNGMDADQITCSEFIRRRGAAALHVISKQNHWYRGRDMAEVARFINARSRAEGQKRVILLGISMGGFGVLVHSAAIDCDLMVVAGPQVIADHDRSIAKDDRYREQWTALRTPEWHDWADATEHCARNVPIRLIYDPFEREDAWHASFLRKLPNVSIWRTAFAGHEPLGELGRARLWVPALEAVIDDDRAKWQAVMNRFRPLRHERYPYNLTMGARYLARGRMEHAARHFRRVTEIRPGFIAGHEFLAMSLRGAGRRDEAIAVLEHATSRFEGDDKYWVVFRSISYLHAEIGRIAQAHDALRRGKAMFPRRSELEAEHALLCLHTARNSAGLATAAKHAARAVRLNPANLDHRLLATRIYAQRARLIADRGRGRTVLAALERIAATDAADVNVRQQLSHLYERMGRMDDALAIVEPLRPTALGADPDRHWVVHRIANLHAMRGDRVPAAEMLRALAAVDPSPHVLADLAEILEQGGDRAAARLAAEEAVARFGTQPGAYWLHQRLAGIHLRAGDLVAAEAAVGEMTRLFPEEPGMLVELAQFRLGGPAACPPAASRLLRRAVELAPDNAEYRALLKRSELLRARRVAARGATGVAMRLIRSVISADPGDVEILIELGHVYAAAGDRRGAIAAFRAAADHPQLGRDGWNILHELTALHAREGDLDAAEAALIEAARRYPKAAATHYELGKFQVERPRPNPAAAARSLRRALALDPANAACEALLERTDLMRDRIDLMRAKTLLARGRPGAAALIHARRAEAAPDDVARQIDLADALEAAGQIDQAVATLRRIAHLKRDDADGWWPHHRITALRARQGDLDAAEAALIEAADKFPDHAGTIAELGKFKYEKNPPDFPEAARLLRHALALAPDDARTAALLERCRAMARSAGVPIDDDDGPWRALWRGRRSPAIAAR